MTVRQQIKTYPGVPYPMGVSVTRDGRLNFAAALRTKEECGVLLYLKDRGAPVRLPFHMGKKVGNIYCLQVDGLAGSDFKYNFYAGDEVITDPYAAVIYGNEKWGRRVSPALKGGICAEGFDWGEDRPPMTPLSDSILYLLHVRGFTRHMSSGVEHKGTYAGIMEKIPYLKELGITAVELMPSCEFVELEREKRPEPTMEEAKRRYMENPEAEETPRINYWGYKEGYYFAPKYSYAASGHPAEEFKSLVKALHVAGIIGIPVGQIIHQNQFRRSFQAGVQIHFAVGLPIPDHRFAGQRHKLFRQPFRLGPLPAGEQSNDCIPAPLPCLLGRFQHCIAFAGAGKIAGKNGELSLFFCCMLSRQRERIHSNPFFQANVL